MSDIKRYKQGETIFSQQSACDGVYIIASGLVSISTEYQGKKMELAVLGRGSMFGEMAVIDLQSRSATATAMQDTEIVTVSTGEFQANIHSLPLWSQLLIQMLVRRLRCAVDQISKLQTDRNAPVPMLPCAEDKGMIVDTAELKAEEIAKGFNG